MALAEELEEAEGVEDDGKRVSLRPVAKVEDWVSITDIEATENEMSISLFGIGFWVACPKSLLLIFQLS